MPSLQVSARGAADRWTDDNRPQDQARIEFIQDMDEDRLTDLRTSIMGEVMDLLMNGDAIGALRVHDNFFDRVMARAGE